MSLHSLENNVSFQEFNLDPSIFKAISACGYTQPTPIQAKSIPSTLTGKDIVACAQTGSGKTAAFVLPALHRLSTQTPSKKTRILILTPTRELAAQITKAASLYGKFLKFNIISLVGGVGYGGQIKDLARGADIIVATPGRLLDHIQNGRVNLSDIEMLVLDEADRMLDMGFIDDVQYIAKLTPSKRQTLLFSATIDKRLSSVINQLLKDPIRIDLSNEKKSTPQITQSLYKVNQPQQKWRLLKHFLQNESVYKAIIFSATKINADKLANQLCHDGFSAAALHGDLRQNVRNRTVDQLRRGKIQFLVATDVAARGIDIPDVTHVFNYDLPRFCEDYVHRIGRTGRAGKSGIAISFVMPSDMRHVQNIERFIGKRLTFQQADTSLTTAEVPAQSKKSVESTYLQRQTGEQIKVEYKPREKKSNNFKPRSHRQDDNTAATGEKSYKKKSIRSEFTEDRPSRHKSDKFKPHSHHRDNDSAMSDDRPFKKKFKSSGHRRDEDTATTSDRPFKNKFKPNGYRRNEDTATNSDRPFKKKFKADSHRRDEDTTTSGRPFKKKFDRTERSEDRSSRPNNKFKPHGLRRNEDKTAADEKPFKKKFTRSENPRSKGSNREEGKSSPADRRRKSDKKPFGKPKRRD